MAKTRSALHRLMSHCEETDLFSQDTSSPGAMRRLLVRWPSHPRRKSFPRNTHLHRRSSPQSHQGSQSSHQGPSQPEGGGQVPGPSEACGTEKGWSIIEAVVLALKLLQGTKGSPLELGSSPLCTPLGWAFPGKHAYMCAFSTKQDLGKARPVAWATGELGRALGYLMPVTLWCSNHSHKHRSPTGQRKPRVTLGLGSCRGPCPQAVPGL